MIGKRFATILLAFGLFFLTTTSAEAKVCAGPWVQVPLHGAGVAWGPESRCECGWFRGGAYASSSWYGLIWTDGMGQVTMKLQFVAPNGETVGTLAKHASGALFAAGNYSGIEGSIYASRGGAYRWNGRYQAVCEYRP